MMPDASIDDGSPAVHADVDTKDSAEEIAIAKEDSSKGFHRRAEPRVFFICGTVVPILLAVCPPVMVIAAPMAAFVPYYVTHTLFVLLWLRFATHPLKVANVIFRLTLRPYVCEYRVCVREPFSSASSHRSTHSTSSSVKLAASCFACVTLATSRCMLLWMFTSPSF